MADTTSVGTVQLDVEINPKSLNAELSKLGKVFNSSFKSMFSGMAKQNNNFVKDSISKIGSGFKNFAQAGTGSSEKVSKSVGKMNTEYEKTETKIKEIREELAKLFAEQDAIARNYQDMPALSGMTKDETIEQLLRSDLKYNELSAQIDKLITKLDPLVEKNKELANEIENVGDKADKAGNKFNKMGNSAKKAGKHIFNLTWLKKLFTKESKKATNAASNFGNTMNRVSRMIARNLIVYGLIIKGLKGIISYMWSALKTNQQFAHSLNVIRTNLRVAFQPIYDFILPALNTLMKAVSTVTTYIASAISALFGKTYKQSFNAAKNLDNTKKAMAGYGKAAKKAGKDAQGALMGFDEINQLDLDKDDDTGGGGAGDFEMTMPDLATIDMSGIDKFKEIMSQIFEPFKTAWENEGQATIDAIKYALESIKELVKAIGRSWLEVWTNGTGQKVVENILKIIQNIFNIVGNLATAFKNAWNENEVGVRIIQGMFDIFNIILETIKKITGSTAEWAKTLDFSPLLESISTLLEALKPLAQNIGDGLVWLWENALLPLAGWVIEDAIPVFLELLAGALGILNEVIEIFKPFGAWLWDKFLEPLAKWTGGIIVSVLESIADSLKAIGEWISDHKTLVENMAIVLGSFAASWGLVNLALNAWNIGIAIWNGLGVIAAGVTTAFGTAMAFITSPIGLVTLAIGAVIAIGVLLYKHWEDIAPWLKETWEGIKNTAENIWNGIEEFFIKIWDNIKTKATTIFTSIKDTISNIFNTVKTTISNIWNNITGGLKKAFNTIYNNAVKIFGKMKSFIKGITDSIGGFFKGMVNGVIKALNFMIRALNKLKFEVPDWVPLIGGKKFGFNIPEIPELAKGGITNGPMLAMVGDNPGGKEVVSPLNDLMGMIQTAVNQSGGNSTDRPLEINLILDNTKLGRATINSINSLQKQEGRILLEL